MTVFYFIVVSTFIFSIVVRLSSEKNKKAGILFLSLIISIFTLVSGLREGIGDTGMYKHLYGLIGPKYDANGGYEPGFILLLRILKYISTDPQFMLIVTSIIINVSNIVTIYKYTKDAYFEIGIFMYITSGYYIVTMNGIRQSLAAAIIFYATTLIVKGKFKTYCIVILLMSTIHTSALIMIPIYFIVRKPAWEKTTNIIYGLSILGLFLYEPLMNMVMKIFSDSRYSEYVNFDEGGANIIRIAVFIVPVILAYLKRDVIKENWKYGDIFVNINIICLIVMLFSAYNWIFARFTVYFQLYSFVLLPYIIKNCFKGKERRLIYFGLLVCYFMFFYYDQAIVMGMDYESIYDLEKILFSN